MRYLFVLAVIALPIILGCSGGGALPSSPDSIQAPVAAAAEKHHMLWGYWQGIIDPVAKDIEFVPLRNAEFHLNALVFLEPPPLVFLSLESLEFNGDIIEAGIGLRHPFLGLTEFTGFDVCGIFISNGSVSGFSDANLVMAGDGDTRLLNPDGYSRWWNPAEFPADGSMLGYKDGLLGTPDSNADYNSTVNGYKYFCDDLEHPDDPLTEVTLERRGMFSAGKKNVRHYTIELGAAGLIFNYAVDASWVFPTGGSPWSAPEDFPPAANRPEAWRLSIGEIENTLWNDGVDSGGDLTLRIDVYDWFNADSNMVRVESPGNLAVVESGTITGVGDGYSTYEVEITDATPGPDEIDLLISVISEEEDFEGFIPGTNTAAYFTHSVPVSSEAPPGYHWEFDAIDTFAGDHSYWNTTEFNDISPALIEESDGDIALNWCGDDENDVDPSINAIVWVRRSIDNGATYGYEIARSAGDQGYRRCDSNKIAAGSQANAYAYGRYGPGIIFSDVIRVETGSANRGVLVCFTTQDLELFVDATGYIYCFDGAGTNVEMKHSQAPETLIPTNWGDPSYQFFTVATGADVSHVRSADMDSSDVVWLAFYDIAQTEIGLAHTTDASPHESWDASTVVYSAGSGISQVKDPSLWIDDNDVFHICYTRFGMVTGLYELVYTADDSSFDNPTEEVLYAAPGAINDAHISVGEKFGKEVIIVIYEHNESIYLITLVDGKTLGPPEEIDDSSGDIDPDAILDADQCDFHTVWATMDGDNYDIARRNGVLVED